MTHCLPSPTTLSSPHPPSPMARPTTSPTNVRRVPKLGIEVPADVRPSSKPGLKQLDDKIAAATQARTRRPRPARLCCRTSRSTTKRSSTPCYQEFFDAKEIPMPPTRLLAQGIERAEQLADGKLPGPRRRAWSCAATSRRSTARCSRMAWSCRRRISRGRRAQHRLDFWFHGRGETLSELNFIDEPPQVRRPVHAADTHRAASLRPLLQRQQVRRRDRHASRRSTHVQEALPHRRRPHRRARLLDGRGGLLAVRRALSRPLVRRRSGGRLLRDARVPEGLPERRRCSRPGTSRSSGTGTTATDYALNLFNCPTVAYSGEIDNQKQAADIMAKALKAEGIELDAHHRPEDRRTRITRRRRPRSTAASTRSLARRPRPDCRREVRFTTYTLRYNQLHLGHRRWPGPSTGSKRQRRRRDRQRPTVSQSTTENVDATDARRSPPVQCPFDIEQRRRWINRRRAKLDGAAGAVGSLVDGSLHASRRGTGRSARRLTIDGLAQDATACKARSTTPSWTAS